MSGRGTAPRWGPLRAAAREHAGLLALGVVLTVASSAAGLLIPTLAGNIVGTAQAGASLAPTIRLLVGLLLAEVSFGALGRYLLAVAGERVVFHLRTQMIRRILRAELSSMSTYRTGDLISRISADTILLRDALSRGVVELFISALFLIGASILMIRLDVSMFLIVGSVLLVTVGGSSLIVRRVREASMLAQSSMGQLSADIERAVTATRTIRMAQAEPTEISRLTDTAATVRWAGTRAARLVAIATPLAQLAASGALLVALVVGAARVGEGSLTLGALVSFLLYTLYLLTPLSGLLEGTSTLRQAEGTQGRIRDILSIGLEDTEAKDPAAASALTADPAAPALDLEGVHFTYDQRRDVLRNVSFKLEPGTRAALVGPSGAGKSTIFALVCGFRLPHLGSIAIAGHDLAHVGRRARSLMALVEQDAPMLHGSIRENLLMADPGATDDRLAEVIERVQMTAEIANLPNGLDTGIGEHGQFLSGGQRQRLAIARALLTAPALLLLDEPTSNLDEDNENAVLGTISQLPPEQTVLIISHRPRTLESVDRIVFLDDGAVRGIGTYEDLTHIPDEKYRSAILDEGSDNGAARAAPSLDGRAAPSASPLRGA